MSENWKSACSMGITIDELGSDLSKLKFWSRQSA